MFDYSHDSGDDWEEEEEVGEDILSDVASDGEDIDDEDEDDGFLVPDDETESLGVSGIISRSPSPSTFRANIKGKRKAEGGAGGVNKRRQIVGPLIPFSKGPCYEDEIGRCEYEPFNQFRIQLLNGASNACTQLLAIYAFLNHALQMLLSISIHFPLYRLVRKNTEHL